MGEREINTEGEVGWGESENVSVGGRWCADGKGTPES